MPLLGTQRGDRRARRWLAESLLLRGELEEDRGDRAGAERSWGRAREVLAPVVDARTRDHELLVPWLRSLELLGHTEEASRARAVLEEIGCRTVIADQ